jgi:hypothetical protein
MAICDLRLIYSGVTREKVYSVAHLVSHYATNRKVASSILDGVTGIFQ